MMLVLVAGSFLENHYFCLFGVLTDRAHDDRSCAGGLDAAVDPL